MIIAVNFPTYAVGKKKPEKNQSFNGIWTHDLRNTVAMLYQLSYEAIHWEQGQLHVVEYYLYIETRVSSLICRHSKGLLLEILKFVYIFKPVIDSNNQFQEQCKFMMLSDEKRPIFLG